MLQRQTHINHINSLLRQFPIVVIIGARQVGKTTIAQQIRSHCQGLVHWFDLEDPIDLARLQEPMLALQNLMGLTIIDEVQLLPNLFSVLRVLVDNNKQKPGQFLLLGSAAMSIRNQAAETLAGRIAYYELGGFSMEEIENDQINQLWLRGGFPRSFLAESDQSSSQWREQFIRTFLERDLPQLGIRIAPQTLRRFWMMIAHYHGNVWNASELARSFGVSPKTINHYLDILTSTFVIRQVQPWHVNIGKRQIKSPKIYFTDSGLLHQLLGQTTMEQLESHPKVGASWEGFVLEQLLRILQVPSAQAFFWATHSGAEIDLFITYHGRRLGFEFKRTLSPQKTRSMHSAIEVLNLNQLYIIYPGDKDFIISDIIQALSINTIRSKRFP